MSGDHNQFQKGQRWKLKKDGDDLIVCFDYTGTPKDQYHRFVRSEKQNNFECPRCGHCCQALETEKQEPVAWANSFDLQNFDMKVRTGPDLHHTVPLYTAPPKKQWVGLTHEELRSIREWQRIQQELGPVWAPMMRYLYEAIEAKLKEKCA